MRNISISSHSILICFRLNIYLLLLLHTISLNILSDVFFHRRQLISISNKNNNNNNIERYLRFWRKSFLLSVNDNSVLEDNSYNTKGKLEPIVDYGVINDTSDLNKGHPHTDESKAKISAANKGKTPWNVGRQHSEETKRKIAEKTKAAILKRKTEKANQLGLTLEEYENNEKEVKVEKRKAKIKGGLTEEGRKKISDSVKKRWEDASFRESYSLLMRGNRKPSLETREKISKAIKEKWKTEEYRSIERKPPSPEVRAKISATLKAKWEDPVYREKMRNATFERTDEWRAVLSMRSRERWKDPVYRLSVETAIRNYFAMRRANGDNINKPKKNRNNKNDNIKKKKTESEINEIKQKKIIKKDAIKSAKLAAKQNDRTVGVMKNLLGGELWFEEKMKRAGGNGLLLNDEELEKQLFDEWSKDSDGDNEDDEDEDLIDEDDEFYDDNESDNILYVDNMDSDDEDLIEVYNEDGELVGIYDIEQFRKMQYKK